MQTTSGTSLSGSDPDAEPQDPDRKPRRFGLLLAVAVAAYAIDVVTKTWAVSSLAGQPPIEVLGDFLQLRLTRNPGAAFSLGTSATFALSVISIVVVVVVIVLGRRVASPMWAVALGLLLGGAIGNLIDRIRYGYVVDFVDAGIGTLRFYTFNVADSAITGAILLLILLAVFPALANLGSGRTDA